ncbi:protein O-mannose kinase [Patella vulgata]|uniref:protein O-mannose kinase n=1 Tax=Patella vulgata TaxID=6465 RepID=UPI0021802521|nr:protein O-mannose kinase [Patella vulgata]XP_050398794.1 protein O-mannose kinase [Patella vulgata]XP_050398795.1 protein O-mannose kinase [Patella vulgata]
MNECHQWLNCQEIDTELVVNEQIGEGAVKKVYLGQWKENTIVINKVKNPNFRDDFQDGLTNLMNFQPDTHVVQLIGYCWDSDLFITEYHELKSADRIEQIFYKNQHLDHLQKRFELCLKYIEIINFLHTGLNETRVMCDSNEPHKALSQLLVRDDLSLILNDADALPQVNRSRNELIKCGHKELTGAYVAPEQLWPFDSTFSDSHMPGYDEKTDIWKIPDVCKVLFNERPGSTGLLLKLFDINSRCKNENPLERPTAQEVYLMYQKVYNNIFNINHFE